MRALASPAGAALPNAEAFPSEGGTSVPKDWPEFIDVQEKIKRARLIPLLVGSTDIADWGMDLIFDQVYGEILPGLDLHKDPVRELSLAGYLDWDEIRDL